MNMKLFALYFALGSLLFGMRSAVEDLRREMSVPYEVEVQRSTVRGMLVRVGQNNRSYPASGIMVRLSHPQYGLSSPSYSGADGMFYLYNCPASPDYTLEVWLSKDHVLRFKLTVLNQQFTDVAPIRVP